MARTLGAAVATAVAAETAEFIHLIELTLADTSYVDATTYLSTGATNIAWNGHTWIAIGGVLQFDPVTEAADLNAAGCTLTLSGVDQTMMALLLQSYYIGRLAVIRRAHLNTATKAILADPVVLFSGTMDGGWEIEEDPPDAGTAGTCTLTARLISQLARLEEARGMTSSMVSHQATVGSATDTFFEFTDQLANAAIVWKLKG